MPLPTPATPRPEWQASLAPCAVSITWIPVAETLPSTDTIVLVHMPKASSEPVWFGYYDSETGFWKDSDGSRFRFPIKHWATLPEPPNS